MDIIRDLIQTSNASRLKVRIVNNNGILGVVTNSETTPTLPTEIVAPSAIPTEISVVGASSTTIGTTERIISFPYSGSAATKDYTFTTTENLICDILIVGGGGSGGNSMGGGGGAGGVVYAINQTLSTGTYTVKVGRGGIGLTLTDATGQGTIGIDQDGVESSLMNSNASSYISLTLGGVSQQLRGYGGGGGGIYYNPSFVNGRNGGSGGGCTESNNNGFVVNTAGSATQPATYWNGTAYVVGGKAGRQNTTTVQDYQAGGGGGLGGVSTDYRNGNDGVAISITGTSQFYAAGGGAGQYIGTSTAAGLGGSSIGGNGRIWAGSAYAADPRNVATSGVNGTGSGGGGAAYVQTPVSPSGSGGSGIVIIRYRKPSSEIVVSGTIAGTTDRYISFPYSGTAATKDYTITTTEALSCDILVVGGGGCGGRSGGGGGAVLYTQNVYFPTGGYTVKVGNGGISLKTGGVGDTQGANGNDSDILFGAITIFRAKGGGFGAANYIQSMTGGTGGSGGGSENRDNIPTFAPSVVSSANIISTNTSSSSFTILTNQSPNGITIYGNRGGIGGSATVGGNTGYSGGGGGGAGGVGGNFNASTLTSGAGGAGISINITGSSIKYGSGGASGIYNGSVNATQGTSGTVDDGGGTGAYTINTTSVFGSIPTAGRGGGGGGWGVNPQTGEQLYAKDGGSGIIIIRYRKATNTVSNTIFSILNSGVISTSTNVYSNVIINYVDSSNVSSGTSSTGISSQWTTVSGGSITNIYYNTSNVGIGTTDPVAPLHIYNNTITPLPTAISVVGATSGTIGTTERIISFPYSGSANTKDYTFTTTENLICDILIVGGGGAGSGTIGGGGGAGALIFARNATLSNGTYTISVGKGGTGGSTGQGTKGNSSSISKDGINITAEGGGASGRGDGNQNGGSGGGGDYWEGNQTRGTSTSYTSTAFGASIVKYGNNGANAYTPSPFNGGGGGGAGSSALIATSTNLFSNGGIGLHQVIIDGTTINFAAIFGTNTEQVGGVLSNGNLYYGGGGGGGGNETSLGGTGGIGGGGNGGAGSSGSVPPYIPIHGSNGFPNTGGGGGGGSNHPSLGGNGGSGIVIIRYRLPTVVSNSRLLLDTTTTGTPSIEFRRGVGADMQNDYRLINDTSPANGTIKLLCENSTQSFNDTTANLAWFSSNETIIHKNTSMNGRVGIGTSYHATNATRRLDVLGDANISGAVSAGGLSVSGSSSSGVSAIISNSLTSNTSLTIQNGMIPPSITSSPVATTTGTTGAFTYQVFTYTTETAGAGTRQSLYTFTTSGTITCDILMIGGGGAGGRDRAGGGGAGSCIIALSQTLGIGTYNIKVGNGQTAYNNYQGQAAGFGYDCEIYLGTTILYRAKGGGMGGSGADNNANVGGCGGGAASQGPFNGGSATNLNYIAGNLVNANTTTTTYANLGFKGGDQLVAWNGANLDQLDGAGGGGIGGAGINHNVGEINGTAGGASLDRVTINGTTYVFKDYFAGGGTFGVNGFIGGGGGGGNLNAGVVGNGGGGGAGNGGGVSAISNTGSGGGGGAASGGMGGNGGSGIVIIRYLTSTSSSIELIRGTAGDANRDYKIGNYNAEFKVLSSVSNTDTDYIKITTAGAITNPTGTASWNTGSDRRIKENIERASYDKCFDNINRLELNRFNYIDGFNTVSRDRVQLGFIAQEVKDIFPKSISTQGYYSDTLNIPDLLSIDISQINYSLYGAVKKLIEINKEDKEKLASLDNRIKTITNFLNISLDASDITIDTSNLLDTSNIAIDTSNLLDTSNITIDTSNLLDTSNIAIDTSNLLDTSNITIDTSDITIDTSNITIDTSNITIDTSNITIDTSNLLDTSNIAIDTSNLLDNSNIILDTSNLLDTSSNISIE